jgi:Tfp pilus assembly protein PilX
MTNRELKSKVMSLGNRLAAKGCDRSAAFERAWRVVKAGELELAVKGVTFGNRQEALRRLAAYDSDQVKTFLVPECRNPADPAAVAVMVGVQNGKGLYRLGYVPRETTGLVRALPGRCVGLRVVSGCWNYKGRGRVTFGARITLAI